MSLHRDPPRNQPALFLPENRKNQMLKKGKFRKPQRKTKLKNRSFFGFKKRKPTYKIAKTVKPKIPTPPSLILVLVMYDMYLNFLI